ncbi:restriction endonuclease subunit S [Chryseobacterium arthrosphaerae]|uniref:restriction endonuclease subunit S n=1 Tax=Chryseobacterium arthrosphaerae TaxID=651561 RepID=UPI0031CE5306
MEVLPKNWVKIESNLVSDITDYVANGSFKTLSDNVRTFDSENFAILIRLKDFNTNFSKDLKYIDESSYLFLNKSRIEPGDLFISNVGNPGICYIVPELNKPMSLGPNGIRLRSKNKINVKFIKYYLESPHGKSEINNIVTGTAQLKFNKTDFRNLKFPLPPLPEQERIVAKLDALFAQHEAMKKALERIPQLLKDFRQQVLDQAISGKMTERWRDSKNLNSYLVEIKKSREKLYLKKVDESLRNGNKKPKKLITDIFNYFEFDKSIELPDYWQIDNLKNICDLITDGEHSTPKRTDEGYFLLSARNVRDGFISFDNVDYVCESEFNRLYQRCNPEHNDILISCSGSVGRVSVFPEGKKAVMVRSAALLKLQSNKNISKFIEFVLRSNLGQKQIKKLTKSTAQANLFLEPIGKIVIPIPSFEEIEKIINKIESLFSKADAIEKRYQTLKEKIDSLPQAILHKAFKGELVPQLPTDGDAKDLLEEILKLKKEVKKK